MMRVVWKHGLTHTSLLRSSCIQKMCAACSWTRPRLAGSRSTTCIWM